MFAKWHDGQEGDLALKLKVWSQVGFFFLLQQGRLACDKRWEKKAVQGCRGRKELR